MDWSQLVWENKALWWVVPAVMCAVALGHALLFAWKARVRRRLGSGRYARALLAGASGPRAFAKAALATFGAGFLALAIVRPQYGMREVEVAHTGIDIAILLDASKSMLVQDVAPNRLGGAVLEINKLLGQLQGGRVALVPFAGVPFVQTPLTSDFEVIRLYLRDLHVQDMPVGGTSIGRALLEGLRVLTGQGDEEATAAAERPAAADTAGAPAVEAPTGSRYKALVLFTDGEENVAETADIVRQAREKGVRVFTVGVGTRAGRPIPIVQEDGSVTGVMKEKDGITPRFSALNEPFLAELADATDGAYFSYGGRSVVPALYSRIEQLEKKEFADSLRGLGEDRFPFALLPGIVLLLAEALLSERRKRGAEALA